MIECYLIASSVSLAIADTWQRGCPASNSRHVAEGLLPCVDYFGAPERELAGLRYDLSA